MTTLGWEYNDIHNVNVIAIYMEKSGYQSFSSEQHLNCMALEKYVIMTIYQKNTR